MVGGANILISWGAKMPTIEDVTKVTLPHWRPNYCTLNRLWLKHHKGKGRRTGSSGKYSDEIIIDAPELNAGNTTVTEELRSTKYLFELAGDAPRPEPYPKDDPVVIVRFRNNDYLIDGGKRIYKWHQDNNQDKHRALVVTVKE